MHFGHTFFSDACLKNVGVGLVVNHNKHHFKNWESQVMRMEKKHSKIAPTFQNA